MTKREILIDYVKNGGQRFFCSPQIGAGAGFDTKIAKKTWIGDTTIEDTRKAWEMFDVIPLYNYELPQLHELTPKLEMETALAQGKTADRRLTHKKLITALGSLASEIIEDEGKGALAVKYFITEEEELEVFEYYLDCLLEVKDFSPITDGVRRIRSIVGEDSALDLQWAMQPYELLCFPNTVDTAVFALTCPDIFKRLMDKILELDERLLLAVSKGGADFVFLGGPGSELISPQYYRDYLVPYSKIVTEMAHKNGLLVYTHICSKIEPMLSMGFYNEMGIDLFETLSEEPVGNVKSIEDAFLKLDPKICTRGNIGLDKLLLGTPQEIKEISFKILETAKRLGRKHILAASDYMFYDTPVENVRAMAEAAAEFNGCPSNDSE